MSIDITAQGSSDIYLMDLKNLSSNPSISNVRYLTDFNKGGYNNQAMFFSFNELYVSSQILPDTLTDIYKLNLTNESISQVTNSPSISEYSPTPCPDKTNFTTVRIEQDRVTQTLWQYPLNQATLGIRLFPKLNNIGYHAWINDEEIALFLVGEPHTLAVGNLKTGKIETIVDKVGRCIKKIDDHTFCFVHKINPTVWTIKRYDTSAKAMTIVTELPADVEDFEILIDGSILIGDRHLLKKTNPIQGQEWKIIADFSALGINHIVRPQVIRDRLIFVNNK